MGDPSGSRELAKKMTEPSGNRETNAATVREGELLWNPSPAQAAQTNLTRFTEWLERERGRRFTSYEELWRWSVSDLESFWQVIWDYFAVQSSARHTSVLGKRTMP